MRQLKRGALARLICLTVPVALISAIAVFPQSLPSINGRWVWKAPARKNRIQVQFTLTVHRKGDFVHGVYSVDEFINGRWQGEDGNQTPFRGRLKGDTIEIDFDPQATVPGYQENVVYSAPVDGRKPSTAVLSLKGRTVLWRLNRAPGIEGVPSQVTLERERRK